MIGTGCSYSKSEKSAVTTKPGVAEKAAFASLGIDIVKINRVNVPDLAIFTVCLMALKSDLLMRFPHKYRITGNLK